MKKLLVLALFASFSLTTYAQSSEIELFQSVFKVEKKALLMDFLKLSDEEGAVFWPIYQEYETVRGDFAKKRIALIYKYAEEYATLTDEQAAELLKESFANRSALEKMHKKYYKKFAKVVGAKRGAQFVQFERFVDNTIDSRLNDNIPLIGEFD